jgi:Tfp pilus assembly protein PilN
MIQLNLLPDIKLDYIKTKRTKRTVTLVASLVGGVSLGLLILLFLVVNVLQKQHIANLTENIERDSQTIQSTQDLNKILTIQNQLLALPALHNGKPQTSRLFEYLQKMVPNDVKISQLDTDYATSSMAFTGTAKDIQAVNKFVDTLKFTTYSVDGGEATKAFPEVVLSSFSRGDVTTPYQISVKYDPVLFDGTKKVSFTVPKTVTTRSQTEKPAALFEEGGN